MQSKQIIPHLFWGGAGDEAPTADRKYAQAASGNRRTADHHLRDGTPASRWSERFIVNTHHCTEKYKEAFPENNWKGIPITFRHETVLLDTAGGIKNIEDLIADDERIIVYNGDIITNMPIELLIRKHF